MYLRFIIFSVLLGVFSFIVFRIVVKRDYEKRSKLSPLSYLLELLVFALHANLVYLALPVKWPNLPALPDNRYILAIYWTLILSGLLILLISWFKLGTLPSFGIDKNKLTTTGLYRYSRNPQLVGYSVMLVAITIAYFSWLVVAWFVLFIVISAFMVRTEEEFLERKYADEYWKYRNKVRRIL
jgi:protein-S-isoprenylcysteine O-methyltransferase Ste14